MIFWSLDANKNPFWAPNNNEEILGSKVSYFSAISTLMYLAYNTHLHIVFLVSLFTRYSSCLTRRHCNRIKQILHFLQGLSDMEIFYSHKFGSKQFSYTNDFFWWYWFMIVNLFKGYLIVILALVQRVSVNST